MRRPSEKDNQKEEQVDLSDDYEVSEEVADDEVADVDNHLEGTRPKKPIDPHNKIKISDDNQKEMQQLETELQKKSQIANLSKRQWMPHFFNAGCGYKKSAHQ